MCNADDLTGRSGEENTFTLASIEQKFQHFLNATVRAGSVYSDCAGYAAGTWAWHDEGHWIIRRRPRIQFGCVCLASSFLAYWYNYNADSEPSWHLSVSRGIQYSFNETLASHNANISNRDYENLCGYKEFVEDGSQLDFYNGNYYATRIGSMADFINDGTLQFFRRGGGNFYFKWNPDRFARFNVLAIGSHHVILHVKRGSEGENSYPTNENTPHQIWRFAADMPVNGPTVWREEEVGLKICPDYNSGQAHDRYTNNQYHTSHGANAIERYEVHPDCTVTNFDPVNEALLTKHVTLSSELPKEDKRWLQGCNSIIVIWKLKDLRANGKAPEVSGVSSSIINNPSKRIVFENPRREHTDVAIPRLTDIQVSKLENGVCVNVSDSNPLRPGDRLHLIISSSGVEASTRISVSVFDTSGDEKLPHDVEITGDTTETDIDLQSIIVPNPPDNYICFRAWIYDIDIGVESVWLPYSEPFYR